MFLPATHALLMVAIAGTALVTNSPEFGSLLALLYVLGLVAVNKGRVISQTVETILAIVLLPLAFGYARYQGDADLISFQYWMTLLLVVRSWKRLQQRDYFFSLCMAAGIYTQIGKVYSDFPFFFLTLLNVLLAPHALGEVFVRFHPSGTHPLRHRAVAPQGGRLTRFTSLGAVSLWLALTMTLVFLVLPRGGQNVNPLTQDLAARLTGFTDNIALGSFARIKENPQIAMRIVTERPGMWRGSVLDTYKGGVWRSSEALYKWRKAGESGALRSGAPSFRHHIQIFNLNLVSLQFFSKGDVVTIKRIRAPDIIWINDLNGTLGVRQTDVRTMREAEYEIDAQEGEYFGLPALTDRRWKSPFDQKRMMETDLYVQVPDDVSSDVRNLSATLTRGMTNVSDKVAAIEAFLRNNFTYSLTDLNSGDRPPLDYFLFDQKQGHCEYYATAMAIMLRCAGVPSRVVQGFGPGILMDGAYVVRMSDAHLWVDVFYSGLGWKSHDPTPVTESALSGDAAYGHWFERLQIKWLTHVMNYNGSTQLQLVGGIANLFRRPLATLQAIQVAGKNLTWNWWVVVVIGGSGVMWAMIRLIIMVRHRRMRAHHDVWHEDGMPDYFKRYLRVLAHHGYDRGADSTAMELLARLEVDAVPVLKEARFLTDLYVRTRYRADLPTQADLSQARLAVAALRRWRPRF